MKIKKAAGTIFVIFLLAAAIAGIFILSVYWGAFGHLRSSEELRDYENATASVVLSEEKEIIGRYFSENRTNISYSQIPPQLLNALISTEDVRFFKHHGIDMKAFFRVFIKSIIINDRSSGGGSTITQQLAKNMFGRRDYGPLTLLVNKTKEIILARRLEKIFTKQEILTLYLNTVSFGENVYGIESAAERFFNRKVKDLDVQESAVLVGILKANTYYNPRLNPGNALKRRNVILKQMEKYGYLGRAEADSLIQLPLNLNYVNFEYEGPADYFLVRVREEAEKILKSLPLPDGKQWNIEQDGLVINTTLNLKLQDYATEAFRQHLSVMQKKIRDQYRTRYGRRILNEIVNREIERNNLSGIADKKSSRYIFDWQGTYSDSISVRDSINLSMTLLHAGLLVMDPETGAVRTWVGGIDFRTQPYDQVLARRQIASTFKPVLYAVAFEEGKEPCNYLDNDSVIISGLEDNWTPQNFDHTYGGKYSLAGSLIHSMNVPTFNLYMNTDFAKLDTMWRKMGFMYPIFNHPSLPLGTAEANIREVAVAFSSFANGGYRINPYYIESISTPDGETIWENEPQVPSDRLMTERTNSLINAILQRAVNEGTGASLRWKFKVSMPLAGKTGTSQDYADAWFTAYNPKIVIVSRVGAASPAIHFFDGDNGSGSALALPLVGITLNKLQQDKVLKKELIAQFPELPPELQDALDCPDYREANIIDKFLDVFSKRKVIINNDSGKVEKKKKSFFRRLFGR